MLFAVQVVLTLTLQATLTSSKSGRLPTFKKKNAVFISLSDKFISSKELYGGLEVP